MANKSGGEKETPKKHFVIFRNNPRFIFIGLIFLFSVVSFSFAAQKLFDNSLHDWVVTLGSFEQSGGILKGLSSTNNFAYHNSSVAYGMWEWQIHYYGSGTASIIFIGLVPDKAFHIATKGYKLHFEVGRPLELLRIDGLNQTLSLASKAFVPRPYGESQTYKITIHRFENNTFTIFLDDVFQFRAEDASYTTSELLELDWYKQQQLAWLIVTDSQAINSWSDSFNNHPSALSGNFFTKVSLYLPFVSISGLLFFFFLRAYFGTAEWRTLLVSLLLAAVIGLGYTFLIKRLIKQISIPEPDQQPSENPTTTPPTGTDTGPTYPTAPSETPEPSQTPNPSPTTGFTGISPNSLSFVLLGISGAFILVALVVIGIDFFKKRGTEFTERFFEKDVRWFPRAAKTEYRKRIIKAYHQSSYDLIDCGVESKRSMTPSEFALSANKRISLPEETLFPLTYLYEEARFSNHKITSEMSEKAELISKEITKSLSKKRKEDSLTK